MKPILVNIDEFLNDDNFISDPFNQIYIKKLSNLKKEFKEFLSQPIKGTPNDVYEKMKLYIIQIQRIRSVLNPKFDIVIQAHENDRLYINIRAYWVNDKGERKRMLNKILGRLGVGETKDDVSMVLAEKVIRDTIRKKYADSEKMFLNKIKTEYNVEFNS